MIGAKDERHRVDEKNPALSLSGRCGVDWRRNILQACSLAAISFLAGNVPSLAVSRRLDDPADRVNSLPRKTPGIAYDMGFSAVDRLSAESEC